MHVQLARRVGHVAPHQRARMALPGRGGAGSAAQGSLAPFRGPADRTAGSRRPGCPWRRCRRSPAKPGWLFPREARGDGSPVKDSHARDCPGHRSPSCRRRTREQDGALSGRLLAPHFHPESRHAGATVPSELVQAASRRAVGERSWRSPSGWRGAVRLGAEETLPGRGR
jgi:hypothetical protein